MANYTRLLATDQSSFPNDDSDDDVLLESQYSIPALWLTIFSIDDVRTFEDEDDELPVIYLVASRSDAVTRIQSQAAEFKKAFGGEAYIELWITLIETTSCSYFIAEIDEILQMNDSGDELEHALSFLGNPTAESTYAFFSLTSLPDVFKDGVIVDRSGTDSRYSTQQRLMGVNPADC